MISHKHGTSSLWPETCSCTPEASATASDLTHYPGMKSLITVVNSITLNPRPQLQHSEFTSADAALSDPLRCLSLRGVDSFRSWETQARNSRSRDSRKRLAMPNLPGFHPMGTKLSVRFEG